MSSVVTLFDPVQAAKEYASIRDQEKVLEARKKELSEQIKKHASESGAKDDKGSFYAQSDDFILGKVARTKTVYDVEKAIAFFKSKGLTECIKTVEILDEDAIDLAFGENKITIADIKEITNITTSYSVMVKRLEEIKPEDMPEVIKTRVAAKVKPIPVRRR